MQKQDYPSPGRANYVLGLLFVTYAFSFVDRQILGVLVGPVKADLEITDFQFSLLQGAAFAILYSFAGLPLGRLADTHNRKWIMGAGVLVWSLATAGSGLARNFIQLFIMRMTVGAGEAALTPAAQSTIADTFPREKLTAAISIYKAGIVVGSGLALILGGAFYEYFASFDELSFLGLVDLAAWQATFLSVGLPGLVFATLIVLTREPERKGMLRKEGGDGDRDVSLKEAMSFMFVEHRQLYVSLFGGCSLLAIVSYGYSSWFTEMLIRTFSLQRATAGAMYGSVVIASGLLGILFAPILVGYFQRRNKVDANMRGLLFLSMGLLPVSVLAPQMPSALLAVAVVAVFGFLQAAYLGIAAAGLQMVTPNQLRGLASAIYIFSVNMLGLAIGSAIVAATTDFVFGDEMAVRHSLSVVSGCLLPGAVFLFWKGLAPFANAMRDSESWS